MSLFTTSKALPAAKTGKAKKEKKQIEVNGLSDLAKLDALIKAAVAMKETLQTQVNAVGFDTFMEMHGTPTRVSSIEGLNGMATASIEMRKRSTSSALNDDEIAVLAEHDIKPHTQIVTNGLYAINPVYAENEDLLKKVEKALVKIVPQDFIVRQEEVSRQVVSDEMLDAAWANGADRAVMKIMTTMAVKPKLSEAYDMANLLADAVKIMNPEPKKKVALPAKKVA